MSGLDRRIKSLEAAYNEEPCPECGFDGDLRGPIEVVWEDLDGEDPEEEGPEFCSTCGHQWVYVITWLDLDDREERQS